MGRMKASGSAFQRRKVARQNVQNAIKRVNGPEGTAELYWCNHLWDEANPWQWVDFIFLSKQAPKSRYYAVALTTLTYSEYEQDRDRAWDKVDEVDGDWHADGLFVKDLNHPHFGQLWRTEFTEEEQARMKLRSDMTSKFTEEFTAVPRLVRPWIKTITGDYRPGCVGVHASLNTPFLDDTVIRNFIAQFYALGEPIADGDIVWQGEEIEVTPAILNESTSAA